MKRAEINELVSKLLAEKGYSASDYVWRRCDCYISHPDYDTVLMTFRSGMSKKRVLAQVALIPAVGPAKVWFPIDPISRSGQIDLETAIMNHGADSGTAHALTV